MPPLNRQILGFAFAAMFAVFPLALFAKDPLLPPSPPGFKMAFEIELLPEKLANLMHLFDFSALEGHLSKASPEASAEFLEHAERFHDYYFPKQGTLTKNYLRDNSRALQSLPAELRAQLTEGLKLQQRVHTEPTKLLGADGNPLQKAPETGLIRPAPVLQSGQPLERPKLILPGASAPDAKPVAPAEFGAEFMQKSGSLEVPNRVDWEKLYQRWENLPEETRRRAVRLDLLSPREKVMMFWAVMDQPDNLKKIKDPLPVRADVSEKDHDLISRLEWEKDGDAVEFRYKGTVDSSERFLDDLRHFAGRADIKKEIFDPEGARIRNYVKDESGAIHDLKKQWGSFHWHASFKGRKLTDFVTELNKNLMIRRLALGIDSDLQSGQFKYGNILGKGLLTLQADNWMEIRTHHEPLEEELKRILSPLLTKSTAEAVALLKKDSEAHLTNEVVRKLAASEHAKILREYHVPLDSVIASLEQELHGNTASISTLKSMLALKPDSPALGKYFEQWLESAATNPQVLTREVRDQFQTWMENPRHITGGAEAKVAQLLNSNEAGAMIYAMREMRGKNWPKPPNAETLAALNQFAERISQSQFESMWDQDLLLFGSQYYKGRKDFLPVLEQILARPDNPTIRRLVGIYIAEGFPGDLEVARRFGPRLLGLPSSATSAEVQKAVLDRLAFRLDGWEMNLLGDTLLAQGPLSSTLGTQFEHLYKVNAWANSQYTKLAYRLGEHDPKLRKLAMDSLKESLEAGRLNALDVIEELKIYDPELLRLVKAFGDKGNTGLAVTVRRILEQAKLAKASGATPKSCSASFAKVAKKKRSG